MELWRLEFDFDFGERRRKCGRPADLSDEQTNLSDRRPREASADMRHERERGRSHCPSCVSTIAIGVLEFGIRFRLWRKKKLVFSQADLALV